MASDTRQARGQALAQTGRVKHVDGALWFVPSDRDGGYLVDAQSGVCPCQDRVTKCKHLWGIEYAQGSLVPSDGAPARPLSLPRGELTTEEIASVKASLIFLR